MCAGTRVRFGAALALLALGGCALILEGTSQEVTFTSDPPGADFTVGGKSARTPVTLDIPKEDYRLLFSRPGFQSAPYELKRQTSLYFYGSLVLGVVASAVDVLSGAWQEFQTDKVHVVLEPLQETVIEERAVRFRSEPPGAEVLLGEAVQGRTPLEATLGWRATERRKDVTFRRAGHYSRTLPLARDQAELAATLDPEPVQVRVRVVSRPAGAEVRLEGRAVGITPLYLDLAWLPSSAPKKVEIARAGYRPAETVLAGPGHREVSLDLAELVEESPWEIRVSPAGARVELDGVATAVAPATVTLRWSVSVQRHTVRVTYPGYAPVSREVTRADASAPLELQLLPSLPKIP